MALANSVTGDGILVDTDFSSRVYFVAASGQETEEQFTGSRWVEIIESETREWVALTKTAAEDAKAGGIQPDDGGTYTYSVDEYDRVTLAYKLTRVYEKKTAYKVPTTPAKAATPTFNPPSGEASNPIDVVITCTTPFATLRYTLDNSTPNWTSLVATSGDIISVPVPGTIKAVAFAVGYLSSNVGSATYTLPEE
jgi:hypothetical protein